MRESTMSPTSSSQFSEWDDASKKLSELPADMKTSKVKQSVSKFGYGGYSSSHMDSANNTKTNLKLYQSSSKKDEFSINSRNLHGDRHLSDATLDDEEQEQSEEYPEVNPVTTMGTDFSVTMKNKFRNIFGRNLKAR